MFRGGFNKRERGKIMFADVEEVGKIYKNQQKSIGGFVFPIRYIEPTQNILLSKK